MPDPTPTPPISDATARLMLAALQAQEAMDRYDQRSYDQAPVSLAEFHGVLAAAGWDGTGRDSDFVRDLRRKAIESDSGRQNRPEAMP